MNIFFNFQLKKLWLITATMIFMMANAEAQSNCLISPISGPVNVSSKGVYVFYVTSQAAASSIWSVPPGATLVSYGTGGRDSAVVSFASGFVDGFINVRRNGTKCLNIISSHFVIMSDPGCNLVINADITSPISCHGGNAVINLTASGGTAPYSGTGNFNVPAGTYNYTVMDANGCSAQASVNVSEPDLLAATSTASEILCHGGSSMVSVTASGGTAPYSGTGNFNVPAGTYNYTVMDANGCSAEISVSLSQPDLLTIAPLVDQTVYYGYSPMACATLSAIVSGGTAPYHYSWTNGMNDPTISACPDVTTEYGIQVIDDNGCSVTAAVKVNSINVICYAGNSNQAKVLLCHIPPGNPGNPQQLCISASAVADHLAHGCNLGSCSGRSIAAGPAADELLMSIYPNPAFLPVVKLNLESSTYDVCDLFIYNMEGKVVMEFNSIELKASESYPLNIDTNLLKDGYYFVKAITWSGKQIAEILVR